MTSCGGGASILPTGIGLYGANALSIRSIVAHSTAARIFVSGVAAESDIYKAVSAFFACRLGRSGELAPIWDGTIAGCFAGSKARIIAAILVNATALISKPSVAECGFATALLGACRWFTLLHQPRVIGVGEFCASVTNFNGALLVGTFVKVDLRRATGNRIALEHGSHGGHRVTWCTPSIGIVEIFETGFFGESVLGANRVLDPLVNFTFCEYFVFARSRKD